MSMIQIQDIARWVGTDRIGHMLREVLTPSLPAVVLLQGGQRTEAGDELLRHQLAAPENTVMIWQRAELENYVLDPDTMARICGADADARVDHMGAPSRGWNRRRDWHTPILCGQQGSEVLGPRLPRQSASSMNFGGIT